MNGTEGKRDNTIASVVTDERSTEVHSIVFTESLSWDLERVTRYVPGIENDDLDRALLRWETDGGFIPPSFA